MKRKNIAQSIKYTQLYEPVLYTLSFYSFTLFSLVYGL